MNACSYILNITATAVKKINSTWVSEFTATNQFYIFSHFVVKLRQK